MSLPSGNNVNFIFFNNSCQNQNYKYPQSHFMGTTIRKNRLPNLNNCAPMASHVNERKKRNKKTGKKKTMKTFNLEEPTRLLWSSAPGACKMFGCKKERCRRSRVLNDCLLTLGSILKKTKKKILNIKKSNI